MTAENKSANRESAGLSRRDAIKSLVVGTGALVSGLGISEAAWAEALAIRQQAAASPVQGLRFFSAAQHRTVDVLSELVMPTDSHSPGASAAKVADFIDLFVSSQSDDRKKLWRDGLRALDDTTSRRHRRPFADCTGEQQVALLTEMSRGEDDPKTTLERFFVEAKARTVQGYYTSEIGIHQELAYKGNQFITEFVGCTHPEHIS